VALACTWLRHSPSSHSRPPWRRPAAEVGLEGSNRQATICGQQVPAGGDVIIAVNNQGVTSFDDPVTCLENEMEVDQTLNLTVLRNGKEVTLKVTLAARPTPSQQASTTFDNSSADNNSPGLSI